MHRCQNCFDRSRKVYPGPICLPRFSTPANTDVGRDCDQLLVQVDFPLDLAFEGHFLDRHHCNCQVYPITSYSRPEQINLPKLVATDGNIQCEHCRLFEITRLPYTNESRNLRTILFQSCIGLILIRQTLLKTSNFHLCNRDFISSPIH